MASFCCAVSVDEEHNKTRAIDRELRQDAEKRNNEVKLLLLGTGECGKSTVMKQMTIIHGSGFSEHQRQTYTDTIHQNIIDCISAILDAMKDLKIEFGSPGREEYVNKVAEMRNLVMFGDFPPEMVTVIKLLWQDVGVQQCYSRSSEYQLNDSARYFLDNIDRVSEPNYLPSDVDILKSRTKTTGITETNFTYKNIKFKVFDVGGQRSERKKWIHCFEGVTAILFIVALSEYDQKLAEDCSTNRLHESLRLFESISNNQWFTNTSIILFFNKTDIFQTKITITPFSNCFADYSGIDNFDSVSKFVMEKFKSPCRNKNKTIYTHFTCATDTGNVRVVFEAVTDVVIKNNLKDSGLF